MPDISDSEEECGKNINMYRQLRLPEYCTRQGTFFEVIKTSPLENQIRSVKKLIGDEFMEYKGKNYCRYYTVKYRSY